MGTRVHIYPDFSASLINKRRQFDAVKKKLRATDIRYSLLYPCTLRVMVEGKPKLFRCVCLFVCVRVCVCVSARNASVLLVVPAPQSLLSHSLPTLFFKLFSS